MPEEERAPAPPAAPPSPGRHEDHELLLLLAEQAVALDLASADQQHLFAPAEAGLEDTPLGSPLATPLTSPVWGDARKATVSGGAAGASNSSSSSRSSSSVNNSKATRRKAAAQATKGAGEDVLRVIVPNCTPPISGAAGKAAATSAPAGAPAGAPSENVKPPIVLAPGKGTGLKRPGMTSSFRGVVGSTRSL